MRTWTFKIQICFFLFFYRLCDFAKILLSDTVLKYLNIHTKINYLHLSIGVKLEFIYFAKIQVNYKKLALL